MSQLSRTNFEALYGTSGTQFPDNTSGSITELIMRTFGKNLSDSFWNSVTDFQKQTTATGTDTYAVTGGISAYASGFTIAVLFTNANTGAATLNVNSLGAKAIKKSGTSALSSGDIAAGEIKILQYDGTNFQIIGGSGSGGGTAATTTFTPAGNIAATDVQAAIEELDTEKQTAAQVQTIADAKVTQNITNGVTTTAPSEDAVFDALALKAPLASPTFTGTPAAPTQSQGDNSTKLATTAYVDGSLASPAAKLFMYNNFI